MIALIYGIIRFMLLTSSVVLVEGAGHVNISDEALACANRLFEEQCFASFLPENLCTQCARDVGEEVLDDVGCTLPFALQLCKYAAENEIDADGDGDIFDDVAQLDVFQVDSASPTTSESPTSSPVTVIATPTIAPVAASTANQLKLQPHHLWILQNHRQHCQLSILRRRQQKSLLEEVLSIS